MSEVYSAGEEQLAGIEQVNNTISQMDRVVQQNAALVSQSAAAASQLADHAGQLVESVAKFRLEGDARPSDDEPPASNKPHSAFARLAQTMRPARPRALTVKRIPA